MMAGESAVAGLDAIVRDDAFPIRCAGLLPQGFYPPLSDNNFEAELRILLHATLDQLLAKEKSFQSFDAVVFGVNQSSPSHPHPEFGLDVILSRLAEFGQTALAPDQLVVCGGACTTGLMALHYAAQRIRSGHSQRVLVLCAEARLRADEFLKLNALGALSRARGVPGEVSRPFAQSRSGFVRGEGAGAIVVESREPAARRGARILGSLLGSAVTSDAWRLTDGREDLVCAVRAVENALSAAGVSKEQIDYINAHGTATWKNDWLESQVIKKVFGAAAYSIPVSSLKSQIGHLNFACGIVEVIASLLMLQQQRIAPTINYFDRDPNCDLDYVPNRSRPAVLEKVLKTGFGFGGSNAAIVLGRI